MPHVRTVACLGGISLERDVSSAEISEYIRDTKNVVWVDVEDPGPEEISMLLEEFGFHPLVFEDLAKGHQRPKVAEYKSYVYIVTYCVIAEKSSEEVHLAEVDLFIGRNYAVSIHREPVPGLEEAYRRWTRGGAMLAEGVGFLIYIVMDAIIDTYFPIIDNLEDKLDETELSMFSQFQKAKSQDLLNIKRNLFAVRRVLAPLRETFNLLLRGDHPLLSANTTVYLRHVYDNILRILDIVEIQRDMVTGTLDAYLTVVSNRMNETVRTLTVMTVVVAIGGLVFGAWGMNFARIPLSELSWGFEAVTGATLTLIGMVLLISWKRGWL